MQNSSLSNFAPLHFIASGLFISDITQVSTYLPAAFHALNAVEQYGYAVFIYTLLDGLKTFVLRFFSSLKLLRPEA